MTSRSKLGIADYPSKSTVLVVDDNAQNLELLQAYLEDLGCKIISAADGIKAMEAVAKYNPDLILLDIMMPRMSGFEVCRRLKDDPATADIPVVMVTGDDKTVKEARDLLGDGIVTVQVKEGLSREGALMYSPKKARSMIREGAKEAMKRIPEAQPYKQEFPATIRWQFLNSDIVKNYVGDAEKIDDRTLEKIVHRAADIISP